MAAKSIGLVAALLAGSALAFGSPGVSPAANASLEDAQCTAMASQLVGRDVKITSARRVAASAPGEYDNGPGPAVTAAVPAHCLVAGIINERKGAEGKDYGIGFELALPDGWNGRFLLQGGGGLNGSIRPPLGPVGTAGNPALSRGFAVISHDSGHKGIVFDSSFMADQRAALDFVEAAVPAVTRVGKQLTESFYGRPIGHSYMTGCSTGGREAMLSFQRYPELFDGIIVGAPAMRTGDSNLAIEYTQTLMNQAAPQGADGNPDVAGMLSPAVRKTILDGVLGQCDKLDGLADGMIENVAACDFKPHMLVCKPGQSEGCITEPLADALEAAFKGPYDKAGYPIYVRNAYDTGIVDLKGGYLPTGAPGPFGPPSTATTIDLDAKIHAIRQTATQRLTDTNYWTNLNTYLDRGGKILFFHGVSDFWFSPFATWDYYERAAEANGQRFLDQSRFYMVPGMMHCQGGNSFDQFDMLDKLVNWVEKSEAPNEIIAHRTDRPNETRPLCPYPQHAEYTGGDKTKASGFACKPPA